MTIFIKDQGIWKEVGGERRGPDIGSPFGGGFVLHWETDAYGLIDVWVIADKTAETSLRWKTATTATSGTSSTTDGMTNTNAMNNSSHPAAQHCKAYRGGGFDDWYLPAKDELNLFWLNLAPGGGGVTPAIFRTGGAQALAGDIYTYYWSSTEDTNTAAWRQSFSSGATTGFPKGSNCVVRPVRRLKT